mmetsp:Transcript_26620/g.87277  ORF Transcript_26620/g.87277 Transcript_26620/m.87277 type:complete len:200 (-) Transcript_26620:2654-3253(-)
MPSRLSCLGLERTTMTAHCISRTNWMTSVGRASVTGAGVTRRSLLASLTMSEMPSKVLLDAKRLRAANPSDTSWSWNRSSIMRELFSAMEEAASSILSFPGRMSCETNATASTEMGCTLSASCTSAAYPSVRQRALPLKMRAGHLTALATETATEASEEGFASASLPRTTIVACLSATNAAIVSATVPTFGTTSLVHGT